MSDETAPRLAPLPPAEREPRTEELLAGLRREPGGPDLNIFATLARHPKLLKRWSAFGGVLLYGGELSGRDRELLILRTAYRCRAHYEWAQHVAIAKAAGVTDDEVARIAAGPAGEGWSDDDALLMRAVDELHEASALSDLTWERLAARYDDKQLIEICMVVGQYHLVAFTLNSLRVQPEGPLPEMPA